MKDTIDTPDGIEWLGVSLKTILAPEATGGAMSIVDTVAPIGFSPPRHIHHAEDEIFVVLTGEMDVWINGEITRAGPGDAAFVPRGTEHSFLVNGDRPCRHLTILTPGGFEQFFNEMAEGECRIPQDMEAIIEAAARHNTEFTGPPLSAD